MKKKISFLLLILSILLTICYLIIMLHNSKENNREINKSSNQYEEIIKKIDNNESINLFITRKHDANIKHLLDYYNDTYSLKCKYLVVDKGFSKLSKKLNTLFNFTFTKQDETVFIAIKESHVEGFLIGSFSEHNFRNVLIDSNIIDKKYLKIDYPINDDEFNNYFNSNEKYSILYIDKNNRDLYGYRKVLVKNNIKSIVLYDASIETAESSIKIDEYLEYKSGERKELPGLIEIANKQFVSSNMNIELSKFESITK